MKTTAPTMYPRRDSRKPILLAVTLAAACAGCAPYNWVMDDYPQAAKLARESNKHLFIYYRWWMSPECGQVQRDVLENPQIHRLFRNTVNCWLSQDWPANQEVMRKFGVETVPAFVIVAPDGTVHKRTGTPSLEQFERFVLSAMPEAATPKKPASRKTPPAGKPARAPATSTHTKKRP